MAKINVILGENGQGKTRYLLNYFEENKKHKHMAVISNSLINPFPLSRTKNGHHFYGLRSRHGITPRILTRTINEYFINLIIGSSLRGLLSICRLIGYEDRIIIRREPLYAVREHHSNKYYNYELVYSSYGNERLRYSPPFRMPLANGVVERYASFLEQAKEFYLTYNHNDKNNQSFKDHLEFEKNLKEDLGMSQYRPLFENRVFVGKGSGFLPLENASSGELYMLSLGLFLQRFLDDRQAELPKVILIDEPENSLHPKWQKKFIGLMIGFLGYEENLELIIASHSPFITMENEYHSTDFALYGISEGVLHKVNHRQKDNNIEQVYFELFGLLTPKSRYLSDYCSSLVRGVAEHKISFSDAKETIEGMKKVAFDNKQLNFLEDVIRLLVKVKES
ncbi:TPA: AAA family ATPase [Citrobacter freundii]|nr:AAA family ATPase [Citrobacter freundii]